MWANTRQQSCSFAKAPVLLENVWLNVEINLTWQQEGGDAEQGRNWGRNPCYGAKESLRGAWKGFWRGGGFVTLSVPTLAENLSTELGWHWC